MGIVPGTFVPTTGGAMGTVGGDTGDAGADDMGTSPLSDMNGQVVGESLVYRVRTLFYVRQNR